MSMGDVCRLCLKVPHNGSVLIDETTRQGLDVLAVKTDFDVSDDPLMCWDCANIFKRSLFFLLVCRNAERTILLFDTSEDEINSDLRDMYINKSEKNFNDGCICRFCIKKVEERNFISLDVLMETTLWDILKGLMFQMDLNVIKNPLICFHCRDDMEGYIKFLQTCYDTEEKINTYRKAEGIRSDEKIMLSNVFERFSKSTLQYPDRHIQVYKVEKEEPLVEEIAKTEIANAYNLGEEVKEEFDTKCEEVNSFANGRFVNAFSAPQGDKKIETVSTEVNKALDIKSEDLEIKDEVTLNSLVESNSRKATVSVHKCGTCDFKTIHKRSLKMHSLIHKTELEVVMYKCTSCNFKTKYKDSLKTHSLIHKAESEVTMYKCTACDYKGKRKHDFKKHLIVHKTEAELPMYECTVCNFKTKHKYDLKSHSLIHKTEAEVTVYKCTVCEYKTIRKRDFKRHSLTHKVEGEITIHKCPDCDYKTIYKNSFTSHSLIHKTEAEVTMHKCPDCDYKTIRKTCLKRHLLTHKNKAEMKMHKCTACDFQTTHRYGLKRHMLTHKTEIAPMTYKCATCGYKAKYKTSLICHSLSHQADLKMFECTECDFKIKYRSSFKKHLWTHESNAEVTMYKCTVCDYKTIRQCNLTKHSLVHKPEAEVTMYRCMACGLKTKYKHSMRKHLLIHKTKAEVNTV